ncbi:MAG: DNA repair protein RadC [Proteobacteria bacterium]|nr:DNA repair protein RadC [Pseudomonadota bacterium]
MSKNAEKELKNQGKDKSKDNIYQGHRQRLRSKFLKSGTKTFQDYEILELLFFYSLPRIDTKPIAKKLLNHFKSIEAIISADQEDLRSIKGVGNEVILHLKLLFEIFTRMHLGNKAHKKNIIDHWEKVLQYCKLTIGFKQKEYFCVLYLDRKNALIADEFLDTGTVDKITIYPREIVKKALSNNASAVILVHNHPSGDCNPSRQDIETTNTIVSALQNVQITTHDHLIISQNQHYSFKGHGLII